MEKQKHILSMLLLIATSLFSNNAFAYDALINGIYYNFNGDEAEVTYGTSRRSYTGDIVIPESVVYNAKTYSVTSIGEGAFCRCDSLTSVTIGNSVTSIGEEAFSDCSDLISVTIGNSVTSIGDEAFYFCDNLTSVTIGNSVASIGDEAFYYCFGLKKVIVSDIAAWCGIAFDDQYANPLYYAKHLYSDETTEITNLIIPNSVTSIGNVAFYNCSGLTSVTIPNSVTSIGGSAFSGCSGLTSVTIPESVDSIGGYAFGGCTELKTVTLKSNAIVSGNLSYYSYESPKAIFGEQVKTYIIGDEITSIGDYVFYGCTGLTSVTIGNSVKSIGRCTFYGCSGLTSVNIPNSVTSIGDDAFYNCKNLKSIIIPAGVTNIGYAAFWGCSNLSSVDLPESLQHISACAFFDCYSLSSVIIGNSVTSIGGSAFSNCSSLSSVVIGNSVANIGNSAFNNCVALTKLVCCSEIPPTCYNLIFQNIDKSRCKLFVPEGSLHAYQTTSPWNEFDSIETFNPVELKNNPDGIEGVEADNIDVSEGIRYDLQGRRIGKPQHGINIIRTSDGTTRKVLMR